MPSAADSVLVLFPGALGDFVCLLPTLQALRERHCGPMRIVARGELLDLVRLPATTTACIDRREVADLFAPGDSLRPETKVLCGGFAWVYSWTGFSSPDLARRLAALGNGHVAVYRFRGMRRGEHAVDYYARCAGVTASRRMTPALVQDPQWMVAFRREHDLAERPLMIVHPGSGAPSKNWQGFGAVVRYWRAHHPEPVIALHGPAETESGVRTADGAIAVAGLSLQQVATLLRHSRLYLGNDSGISHLAGAVGARGVVIFGPSDPGIWAPRGGALHVLHAPDPCARCGPDVFCRHRLPAEGVIAALEQGQVVSC
jgi:heptosyltransferase-3